MTTTPARLTRVQRLYLQEAERQPFTKGWGGMASTITVRILESRGLITVNWLGANGWRVTGLTQAGREKVTA